MYTQASSGDGGKCVSLWNDKPAPHLRGDFSFLPIFHQLKTNKRIN